MKTLTAISTFSVLILSACSSHDSSVAVVTIDPRDSELQEIRDDRIIMLDASDSSMLYDICAVLPIDSYLVVHSRDFLRVYDSSTGKFIKNLSRKGKLPGEYANISSIWQSGDTVNVFDCNRNSIYLYTLSEGFVRELSPVVAATAKGQQPRAILQAPDGNGFYTLNTYTDHTTPTNPKMTYFPAEGDSWPIKGRDVTEGSYLPDGAFVDRAHNRLLVWEPLRDTIFVATPFEIMPLYAIDFKNVQFPSEKQNISSVNHRVKAFSEHPALAASFIRYVHSVGDNLYFSFATNDTKWHLAKVNEKTGESRVFSFEQSDGKLRQSGFFHIANGKVYIEIKDPDDIENNPSIYVIDLDELK